MQSAGNLNLLMESIKEGSSETTREAHILKYEDNIVRSVDKFTVNNKCLLQYQP